MAVATSTALLIAAGVSAAGAAYSANEQKKAGERAIRAEEERRNPYDVMAGHLRGFLGHQFRHYGGDLAAAFRPSNTQMAAEGRIRELLDNPLDVRQTIRDVPNLLVQDYLDQTRPAFGLDLERLGSEISSRYGGQFGIRAGSEIPEAFGRAGAEALTRRQGVAAGLLPAFGQLSLQGTLAGRAEPLSLLQGALASRAANQDLVRLAASFANYNPAPPSGAYMAGGPGAGAAALTSLGSLAAQYPLYQSLYSGNSVAGYSSPGAAGTSGYTLQTPVSEINLAEGFGG